MATFDFKIPQKDISQPIAVSHEIKTVSVPFCFFRYTYTKSKEAFKDTVEVGSYIFDHSLVGIMPFDKEGFLYIYYENKGVRDKYDYDYGAEYQLNVFKADNGTYQNAMYTKIHPNSKDTERDIDWNIKGTESHINFDKGDIVWVAFSEVRWSKSFRERIMNDFEMVKKRFQCIDINSFVEESNKVTNPLKAYSNYYAVWGKKTEASSILDIVHAYTQEEGVREYVFTIASATLFIDDMCNYVQSENEGFKDYIDRISSGIDPETGGKYSDPDEYQALISSASVLYAVLLDMSDRTKSSKEDETPISLVQDQKFHTLLDLINRGKKKEFIWDLQNKVLGMMNSNWFKYTLLEYLDNHETNVLRGQEFILEYYSKIKDDPYMTDMHLFSFDVYDSLRKGTGYNAVKDNAVIKFSCNHFFYSTKEENEKYTTTQAPSITYADITSDFDIIKLLLNTSISEQQLLKHRSKKITIANIYNKLAQLVDKNKKGDIQDDEGEQPDDSPDETETEQPALSYEMETLVSSAARLVTFTDSILWYFTAYVSSSEYYMQLSAKVDNLKELMKGLNTTKTTQKGILSDTLIQINESYRERLNDHQQKIKSTKYEHTQRTKTTNNRQAKKKNDKLAEKKIDYEKAKAGLESVEKSKAKDIDKAGRIYRNAATDIRADFVKHEWDKSKINLEMRTYKQETNPEIQAIKNSPIWINLVFGFSCAGVLSSIYIAKNDKSHEVFRFVGNALGISSAFSQFLAVVGEVYFDNHPGKWKEFVGKMKWKNEAMTFGTRVGIVTGIFQAAADLAYSFHNARKGNHDAAIMYAIAGSSMAMASYCLWSISVATRAATPVSAPMPYLAGALMAVSIVTGIAAGFFEYDEFEDFVAASVFSKGGLFNDKTIDTATYNTSYKMGMKIIGKPSDYADEEYTGLGFTNVNLRKFREMYDVIRSLYAPIKCVVHGSGSPIKGGDLPLIQYNIFRLWIKYDGGMFAREKLEYEARLYPNGTAGSEPIYIHIKLSADKGKTKDGGTLFRFSVNDSDIVRAGKTDSNQRNACLVLLVRVKSLDGGGSFLIDSETTFPASRNGEDCYFGYKIELLRQYYYYSYFSVELQPKPISELLK
ncbi:toxin VasX [Dysgonomonas sp. HGC4]|uniref:toxin VasX n=1 Tax=Dysgonomonas sp. HGC4 TaxID=1658009 RepID=UPI0006808EF5|nr:toxin VasX [Dysgonomonas sp. HGC4]MBD8347646.1 hypothetical protein [Dysgonomonas sp. HGC4]